MRGRSPAFTQVPLDIVGSTKFGRYPKISVEETYNMIISDNFIVPFAGHKIVTPITNTGAGRGLYTSNRFNHMAAVINNGFYIVNSNLTSTMVSSLTTSEGNVFIDENNSNQIGICDLQNIYIYNYVTGHFGAVTLDFIPGYISYQNGRFLSVALDSAQWCLSALGDGTSWPNDPQHRGLLQTKPDFLVAAQRFPGRGNLLYVFGNTVAEPWQDVGLPLFPYQKNSSVNIDYGCLNAATIAYNENIMVWLGGNEKSGPVIMFSTGGDVQRISTDGIDFRLTTLTNPSNSYGFLFRQDGHLLYIITFPDDHLTYCYDFNTKKFFTLSDEYMNEHIAKKIAFFNDQYYFVSSKDGNIYQISTQFTTYDGVEIPRIRMCRNIRMPDTSRFAVNNITFTIEQGVTPDIGIENNLLTDSGQPLLTDSGQNITVATVINETIPVVLFTDADEPLLTDNGDELFALPSMNLPFAYSIPQTISLSVSKNGGQSFGTWYDITLNRLGDQRSRINFWNCGAANDFVPQFRFYGLGRFVATDGIASIYQ